MTAVFAWAAFASWGWWAAERRLSTAAPAVPPRDAAVEDLEKTTFLRQFVTQYLTFDQENYWQSQTALAFLMSETLRNERLHELDVQKTKRGATRFRQTVQLLAVAAQETDQAYRVNAHLDGVEGDRSWSFEVEIQVTLEPAPRSVANPWGWGVRSLQVNRQPRSPTRQDLALAPDRPLVLALPCLVHQVETPAHFPVQVKITSFKTSEIQLVREAASVERQSLTLNCRDRRFVVTVSAAQETSDLFRLITSKEARPLAALKRPPATRARENYRRTLEQELGFVVEE